MTSPRRPADPTELFLRHLFRRVSYTALAGAVVMQAGACVQSTTASAGDLERSDSGATKDGGGNTGGEAEDTASTGANGSGDTSRTPSETTPSGTSGGTTGSAPVEEEEPPALVTACGYHKHSISAEGVTPATPVDYLAVRERGDSAGEAPEPGTDPSWADTYFLVLSETGTPCETAIGDACEAKVKQHPVEFTPTRCNLGCSEVSVVTTSGDSVEQYAGVERLMELFGDVDSLDEAALVATSSGYLTCGARETRDGELLVYATQQVSEDCGPTVTMTYELKVTKAGEVEELRSGVKRVSDACAGRKPAGLQSRVARTGDSKLGDYLARCAHLEAASVLAFEQLAQDLVRLGAPPELVGRARQAADDERRHAEVVGELATTRGGTCVAAKVGVVPVRNLEEVATENAVEGCVRETFGVLLGAHQALRATDRELADAMVDIVRDETRHAALSWDVHYWALDVLDEDARTRVRDAQADAIHALGNEILHPVDTALSGSAGIAAPAVQQRMLTELSLGLWA